MNFCINDFVEVLAFVGFLAIISMSIVFIPFILKKCLYIFAKITYKLHKMGIIK